MNTTYPGGKKSSAPRANSSVFTTQKEDWEKDLGYRRMVDKVFEKHESQPRFSVGDTALVLDTKHYEGFEELDEFKVEKVEGKWVYRQDGNCLPMSCLANTTMNEKEKQKLEQATVRLCQSLEGAGDDMAASQFEARL